MFTHTKLHEHVDGLGMFHFISVSSGFSARDLLVGQQEPGLEGERLIVLPPPSVSEVIFWSSDSLEGCLCSNETLESTALCTAQTAVYLLFICLLEVQHLKMTNISHIRSSLLL